MIRMPSRAALALACALAAPVAVFVPVVACAAVEVATVGDTAVILPAGQWIVAVFQTATTVLLPFLVTIVGAAVAKLYPWARLFISDALVEASLRKWLDYATNAVEGAAKDQIWSVPVGSAVLAKALQRGVDRADVSQIGKWVMDAAGGPAEAGAKLFRMMRLDEDSSAAKVLEPALRNMGLAAK